ncbi:MAG TPA: hypothetical protein VF765_04195, partial [Polyangiaceae bacterium]
DASDGEEAADKALAMNADERRKALEASGFEMGQIHARAEELRERMQRAAGEAAHKAAVADARKKALRTPSNRGRVFLLVAAVAIAAVILAFLLFPRLATQEATTAVPSASTAPTASMGAPTPPIPSSTASTTDASPTGPKPPVIR